MLLEGNAVLLGVVVDPIERAPVHGVSGRFDRAPLAFVFGCDLVPIIDEVRAHLAIGRDVPDEALWRIAATSRTTSAVASPTALVTQVTVNHPRGGALRRILSPVIARGAIPLGARGANIGAFVVGWGIRTANCRRHERLIGSAVDVPLSNVGPVGGAPVP